MDHLLNYSKVINNRLETNYYGDYYSNDINRYISIVNNNYTNIYNFDDIETTGNMMYLNSRYSFI